jgi:hypothetical protein
MPGVLVLAEHNNGELLGISTELLGAARRLADESGEKVTAVSLGSTQPRLPKTRSRTAPTRR